MGTNLVILYINDLPESKISGSQIYLFADNTKIYRQVEGIEDCSRLQEDLGTLIDRSNKWLLKSHVKEMQSHDDHWQVGCTAITQFLTTSKTVNLLLMYG